jgi:LysR family transcriptional regulator, transcriptional activator of nhaA
MFNFNHLYYFYITVKSGSTATAAAHLRISQPALSAQLKVLESTLGLRVFRRVGRRNALTESGSLLFGFCRRMFEVSEELGELLTERRPAATRRISLGVSSEVDARFVTTLIRRYLESYRATEKPKISLVTGSDEDLRSRLCFHELDAIVTISKSIEPDLMTLASLTSPVVLVGNRKCSIEAMAKSKDSCWVLPGKALRLRAETELFIEKNKLKGRVVFESDLYGPLIQSAAEGVGWGFVPRLYLGEQTREPFNPKTSGPTAGYWKYFLWLTCHKQSANDPLLLGLRKSFLSESALP